MLDFTKIPLLYKEQDVVKGLKSLDSSAPQGPGFRHIYHRLFGPSFPGEYLPPAQGASHGTYILSYPGVAFSFPLLDSAWSEQRDFVSLMSSSAASPATSMTVFQGSSWTDARSNMFTRQPQYPRFTTLVGQNRESVADEIEEITVHGGGNIEFCRRSGPAFWITLSETTAQDLIAELGAPDAVYNKNDRRISIHDGQPVASGSDGVGAGAQHAIDPSGLDNFSEIAMAEDVDGDVSPPSGRHSSKWPGEGFYNYFYHGFDVLVSRPTAHGPAFPGSESMDAPLPSSPPNEFAVTKLLLHGNIPGSYPFNRYRRCRWVIDLGSQTDPLTSETPYSQISDRLNREWQDPYSGTSKQPSLQRAMVLNRGWGDSPGSSVELLGGLEDGNAEPNQGTRSADAGSQSLGNTELFGFPGLLFEVLKSGAVSCLTIY